MKSILATLLFLISGCCAFHGTCKEGSAGACLQADINQLKAQYPNLLPLIAELFAQGISDIEGTLAKEGITVAAETVDCLAKSLLNLVDNKIEQVKSGKAAASPEPWLNKPLDKLQAMHDAISARAAKRGSK